MFYVSFKKNERKLFKINCHSYIASSEQPSDFLLTFFTVFSVTIKMTCVEELT